MRQLARNPASILAVLTACDHEMTGAAIVADVGAMRPSSFYAALTALQRDNLVQARWDLSGPRPRRYFRITPAGQAALGLARSQVRAYRGAGT